MTIYNDKKAERISNRMTTQSSQRQRQRHRRSSSSSSSSSCCSFCWSSSTSYFMKGMLFVLCLISSSPKTTQWLLNGEGRGGSYLFVEAQQAPTLQLSQFSTNTTHRQDVCDRYRLHAEGKVDLRDALEGLKLRPIIRLNQFFRLDGSRAIDKDDPGLVALILDEIARRGKFTWRDSFAIAGRPENGRSYTDLLVWGADHYDIFCSWWDITLERLKLGVAFPQGWNDGSYVLVGRDETLIAEQQKQGGFQSVNLWNWLAPFDSTVWYLIIFTVIASGMLYHWLDHLELNPSIRKQPQKYKLRWTSCYLSFLAFTQNYQFVPRSHSARLLAISLAFWSLLICATYTANLASFYVVKNVPVLEVDSIEAAINYNRIICLWKGAAVDNYITEEFPKALIVRKDNEIETYDALHTGECDFVVAQYSTWQQLESDKNVNSECNLIQVGRTIKHLRSGFATIADAGTLCTSLIRDVVNVHLVEMQNDGFLDILWESYLRREQDLDCNVQREIQLENSGNGEDGESTKLGIQEMAGTFLLHWVISGIAALCAIAAKIYNDRQLKFLEQEDGNNNNNNINNHDNHNNTGDQEQSIGGNQQQQRRASSLGLPDPTRFFPVGDQVVRTSMWSTRTTSSISSSGTSNNNNNNNNIKPEQYRFENNKNNYNSRNNNNNNNKRKKIRRYNNNVASTVSRLRNVKELSFNLPMGNNNNNNDISVSNQNQRRRRHQFTKQQEAEIADIQISQLKNENDLMKRIIEQQQEQMERMAKLIQSFQQQEQQQQHDPSSFSSEDDFHSTCLYDSDESQAI